MYMYHSLCLSRTCLHHVDVTAVSSLDHHSQQPNEQVYVLRTVIIVKCHSDDSPPYYTVHVIYTHTMVDPRTISHKQWLQDANLCTNTAFKDIVCFWVGVCENAQHVHIVIQVDHKFCIFRCYVGQQNFNDKSRSVSYYQFTRKIYYSMIPYKFKDTAYALYSIDKIWERIEIALTASPHALFTSQCTPRATISHNALKMVLH